MLKSKRLKKKSAILNRKKKVSANMKNWFKRLSMFHRLGQEKKTYSDS